MSRTVNQWLVKTEPGTYAFQDLQREGRTVWDGVKNALALRHLRSMRPGDLVMVYHSVSDKACVGIARVDAEPYPDPRGQDPRLTVVDLVPVKPLAQPVTLAAIKADPLFTTPDQDGEVFLLVRMSRLSVMPVSAPRWRRLVAMGQRTG